MTLKLKWTTAFFAALAAVPLCFAASLFSGCNATPSTTAADAPAPAAKADPKPDPNFYVYLCFGQSNMEGFPGVPAAETNIDSLNGRFEVLSAVNFPQLNRKADEWAPAVPPLCRPGTGMCPADYFGRTLVENLPKNVKIGVINVSVAGCKIEMFQKEAYQAYAATAPSWMASIIKTYNGNPYQRLVDLGKEAQKDGVIKGILLHQGESNSGDAQWGAKVKSIYDNLIKDLDLKPENTPLFMGELTNGGGASMMNNAAKLIPNSYVIPSKGCGQANSLHFSPDGYKKLGTRYALKELELLNIKPNEDTTQRAQ